MKKYSRKGIVLIILSFIISSVYSQNINIVRGKILDADNEEPLPGVTIVETDANDRVLRGVITDFNGNYQIQVSSENAILKYSFIGYKTVKETSGGRTQIDIKLESESIQGQEVVVTAEGAKTLSGVAQRDIASSSVKVDLKDMGNVSVTSVGDALQGQVTGLDIVAGGSPGGGGSIVIRGLGSLSGASPLIVIDGIAQDIGTSDFDFSAADQEDIGNLVSLAPQDIKSIQVLKDAASTAVWGAKGANGVLEITTNRGTKGKTTFDYTFKYVQKREPDPIPMLNGDEYVTLLTESTQNRNPVYVVPDQIANDPKYKYYNNYNNNTNWLDEITRVGQSKEHFFKLKGGGEKTRYYASISYLNEEGTTLNEGFKRLTSRVNLDYDVSTKLRFSVNFNYTNSDKESNYFYDQNGNGAFNSGDGDTRVRKMAYKKAPNMSVYEEDEFDQPTEEYWTPLVEDNYQNTNVNKERDYFNPVAYVDLSVNDIQSNTYQNSFDLTYKITPKIRMQHLVAFQIENKNKIQFTPGAALGVHEFNEYVNEAAKWTYLNQRLSYRARFNANILTTSVHNLSVLALFDMEQKKNKDVVMQTNNLPSARIQDPAAPAAIDTPNSTDSESKGVGSLISANYIYGDRYIFYVGLRADANTKFGKNNRWGYFPTMSIAWRFNKEPFMQSFQFLDDSKLKFAYGLSGAANVGDYDRFGIYEQKSKYLGTFSTVPTRVNLDDLKWEVVKSSNYGLELAMFESRFTVNAEYYKKTTSDMLQKDFDIPTSSGYEEFKKMNGGKIENKGWEFTTRGTIIRRKDFNLTLNFNMSHNENQYLEFPENMQLTKDEVVQNGKYPRQVKLHQPVGSFYGWNYQGVYSHNNPETAKALYENGSSNAAAPFATTDNSNDYIIDPYGDYVPMRMNNGRSFKAGDAKYEDVNHDGTIDIFDAQYLGDSNPDFIGGYGLNGNYKKIKFSAQFMYRTGFQIVNEIASSTEGMTDRNNQSKAVLYRWKKVGDGANGELVFPKAELDHSANNLGSNRYVEDGDFIRLNNVSISYMLPQKAIQKFGLSKLEVGINLRKIWTLTDYSGQDPEISTNSSDPFWMGTDNGMSPSPKIYSFNVNISF
ncbi:SusC/RagA family TonB-linked outer membrane protein [Bacteroidales bacterium]|nr:SusC/RagA family TonB-linked outer membrane protein [Bacteroidales bacterium]